MIRTLSIIVAAVAVLTPVGALGHAVERGLVLLLPTEYYVAGGALAVAVSFLVLLFVPSPGGGRMRDAGARLRQSGARKRSRGGPVRISQWIGFLAFATLIVIGLTGPRDPLSNLLPLTIWAVWWIGMPLAVAVTGDFWPAINPWAAPAAILRRLFGPAHFSVPAWLGYWPAIAGLLGATWFETVSLAPDDPAILARAALIYWCAHLLAIWAFGDRHWRRRGETFSVLFRLLGLLAPLFRSQLKWPGARLATAPGLGHAGWIFATTAIAAVTFDGLNGTFWWLGIIGINPLEFPGRSAVIVENTVGLPVVAILLAATYAAAVYLGCLLAGDGGRTATGLRRLALSLMPIALAYHTAHYLTVFLINGQYAWIALSDPLGTGADLFGTADWPIQAGFLSDLNSVELIWQVQTGVITIGHVAGVLAAHVIATEIWQTHARAVLSQIPLAILMVGLTLLGLWLLSTPTGV